MWIKNENNIIKIHMISESINTFSTHPLVDSE